VSPRKDASIALTVFRLVDDSTELFEVRPAGQGAYQKARDVMAQYADQSFSFVDAVVFTIVDADPAINRILTVDGRDFAIYRFAHTVEVVVP
jgi:predicted nucleic acid-binding protein